MLNHMSVQAAKPGLYSLFLYNSMHFNQIIFILYM